MGHRAQSQQERIQTIAAQLVRLVLVASACLVLFAGCAQVRFGSTFTEDGTAHHTLEVTLPRSSMNELDLARTERVISDAEMNARSGGLTTARIDNPDTIGLRVINTTNDATDAGLALNSIFNTLVADPTTGPVAPFQGTFERVSEAVGGTQFRLDLTVDGDLLYAAAAKIAPGHPQFATPEGVRELVQIEYVVTMPGEITSTNGGLSGEGSVRWSIPLDGPTQLEARSTVGKDTPWIWTTLVIIGSLAVVLVTAALVWMILLSRRRAGRMRIAIARQEQAQGVGSASGFVTPPESLGEVRESLASLIRRALSGERLDARNVRQPHRPITPEESNRGADTQGD